MLNNLKVKLNSLEVIQLVAAGALFLSPWILSFSDDQSAAWSAWLSAGGLALFATLTSVGEPNWAGWGTLPFGLWAMLAPLLIGFPASLTAWWAHMIVGAVATLASLAILYLTMRSEPPTSSHGMQTA